jgi:isocitrate dehydrogenase
VLKYRQVPLTRLHSGHEQEKQLSQTRTVSLIPGDGIGPEVVGAAQRVLAAVGAPIEWDTVDAGASVFKRGVASGVPKETIDSIERTRLVLKGPLETPVGYGEKSANVTLRKLFETYANIRPVRELEGVPTAFSGRGIDLVVVRENVEDLYAGIEHQQTPEVAQCLKLISRPGCERIVRLAFEYARAEGRTSVVCATKANIMKLTEGLLKRVFEEIAPSYSDIEASHLVVDNCAHQLVRRPEQFDVIVTTNMNGDILSDLTSGLIGGLGFAPSANLGPDIAIFEAVHGSAPKYAGQDSANPTAVILSAALMLRHIGLADEADRVEAAVQATLADGIHTRDVPAGEPVSTSAYTDAIIDRLDGLETGSGSQRRGLVVPQIESTERAEVGRTLDGVDVFVEWTGPLDELASSLEQAGADLPLRLKMISNRGTMVYPGRVTPSLVDHFRCRFVVDAGAEGSARADDGDILELVGRIGARHRWMHLEKLQSFAGVPGYTRAQGEDAL